MVSLHLVRAAMVDLDGTLVDTLGDFEAALRATVAELGLNAGRVDRSFIERTVGKGSEHLVTQTLLHVGESAPDVVAQALPAYQRHYSHFNGQHATVYPGVIEGLQRLRAQGWTLACLTNKPGEPARQLLRRKGLDGYFRHVFGGDAFSARKPNPLPLIETSRALGTAPAATLMIGDSSNDAQAARAAGCPVILVSYGYNHGQPIHDVDADAHIDRLDELPLPALAA